MPQKADRDPFNYFNSLLECMAGAEPYPLAPWLASLDTSDLDFLTDAIDGYTRHGVEMENGLLSNVLAVVIQIMAVEKSPSPSFSCSIEHLHRYVFALGLCCALEQMRRAGVARILSPMILTSDHMPPIDLIRSI
jgi:hypothetical protein